jgi:hypothetical protein
LGDVEKVGFEIFLDLVEVVELDVGISIISGE